MNIKANITELIGKTPLLELCAIEREYALKARVVAKVEFFNPLGSIKDRAALSMLSAAERAGEIGPDTVIVEPTSGNTGVGLAYICAVKGYRLILTMPESMSEERRSLLAALGAEIHLTPAALGMKGAIEEASSLARTLPDSYLPMQFQNPANAAAHRQTTGPEIWMDTDGQVDILVSTIGSGGTLTGTGGLLKENNPAIRVIGVEPAGSPVVSGGTAGPHKIQGIGAGFIPEVLDVGLIDEMLTVTDDDACAMTKKLAKTEGLFVGISSGAAVSAAVEVAKRPENKEKLIVVILPDTGERYLSTGVFGK